MQFNMADMFECVVDAVSDREAVVSENRRLSYAQLDERANRLAHYFQEQGVAAGEHIGLYLYNGTEYLEAMLACFKIRAVPVNINFRYVEEELRYLLSDSDAVGVIYSRELGDRVAAAADALKAEKVLISVEDGSDAPLHGAEFEQVLAASSPERDFPERSADDLFIIYTGGTTGMPKGVMWRHEDIFFAGMRGGDPVGEPAKKPEDVGEMAKANANPITMMAAPPLIHGAAQLGCFIAFWQGNRVALAPRFSPSAIWSLIEREKVNTLSIVGDAMGRPLAEELQKPGVSYDIESLFVIASAGAILSDAVREQFKAKMPNLMIIDSWGSSETGYQGNAAAGSSPDKGLRFQMNELNTVLDDDLQPVKPGSGTVGMLAQRGYIPLGYYGDPEKTAKTFVTVDGERWVLPGDMATVDDDGVILVFGRGSGCINSGGEKIFPEEVEAALKSDDTVFDAVVVGVPDERWGQKVAAVVQARPGLTPTLDQLVKHCRTKIAGYKVPRELHLVDEMVRSPSGKADYPWAKKLAAAGKNKA